VTRRRDSEPPTPPSPRDEDPAASLFDPDVDSDDASDEDAPRLTDTARSRKRDRDQPWSNFVDDDPSDFRDPYLDDE
jgi:hypothetical protein